MAQFEEERDFPYRQVKYMSDLLGNLPLDTQSYSYYSPSGLSSLSAGAADIVGIADLIARYSTPEEQPTTTDVVMADGSVAKVG